MPASKQKKSTASSSQKKQPDTNVKASPSVTPEQRYRMVQESAYYLAEKAEFNGDSIEHWLTAEQEINERFT